MLLPTKLIAAALLLAALAGAFLLYGRSERSAGRLEERTIAQGAEIKWRQEFDRIKADSAARVAKAEANLREARRQTDEKIAELLQRDAAARDWYHRKVPTAFVDLIWLRDSGPPSAVPGGLVPAPRFDITNAPARRPH